MTTTVRAGTTAYRSKSSGDVSLAAGVQLVAAFGTGRAADDRPVAGARVELVYAVRTGAALGDELLALVQRQVRALDRLASTTHDALDAQLPKRGHGTEPIGFVSERRGTHR